MSFGAQLFGTAIGIAVAVVGASVFYLIIRMISPLALDEEEEFNGADLSIHKISATPENN